LIAEVLEEMKMGEKVICVEPAGCSVLIHNYFDFDTLESAHGRGAAVATGIKRVRPQNLVFSYQGDGDLAAIGTAESFHAANRGELITVIFVNNGVYGMTGGQMAPTTLVNQITTTSPSGRNPAKEGHPVRMCEVLATLSGTAYLERTGVHKPAAIVQTKKAIRKAFEHQIKGTGFSMVEILAQCPTNWKMGPLESCKWVEEVMSREFPIGLVKEVSC
jgi:2-oxoglutarate/2-oxoacid ferredoxin oxidoreductase subunit beta